MSFINNVDISRLTNNANQLETAIKELRSRITQCEISINHLHNIVCGYGNGNLINGLQQQVDNLDQDIKEFKCIATGEISELRANLDALTVEPNKKSDLEIFDQIVDFDSDAFKSIQGTWSLYDEDWWNK